MSPSVKWAGVLLAFARSIRGTEVCGVLGTGLKKQVAVTILLLLFLENKGGSSREGQAACEKPQGESGGWAGQGASRERNKRPSQGRSGCSSQEMASWSTQLWPEPGRGGAGEVPGPVGSQATGRWSPPWASAQVVAVYCALTMCQAWRMSN